LMMLIMLLSQGVVQRMRWLCHLRNLMRLMETVHLLKSPANATHLGKSIQPYRAGKTEAHGLPDD
jgi:hypothetical protein